MQIGKIIIISFLLFSGISCVDEYWPEMDKYEDLLVVDGLLTNGEDPAIVMLSISSPIYNDELIPLNDGVLFISDEDLNIIPMKETEPGMYKVKDSSFRGKVGEAYQLHISLPGGKNYISDICPLLAPSPIDSVYSIVEGPQFSNENHDYPGVQFYVDNHSEMTDTSFYFWKLYQTYKYKSSFDIDYTWSGSLIPYPKPDSLRVCWRTSQVNEIIIGSTKYFDPPVISNFPLNFVSTDTKLLSIRYSLLVKQLTISKNAFDFYEKLLEQNEEQGNLWSRQPVQIIGNIRNENDPDEPVLGYFMVAGMSEKRIFADRPPLTFYYEECTPDFESVKWISFEPPSTWPIYIDDLMFLGLAMANSDACFDCRLDGGSITPPDFWE